jgi:protein-S-isoprenylcysteine O-methyltransferase Ste14
LANSWRTLYAAQRSQTLATTGPYAYIRHPQYVAFIAIMFGFLLQWPTIPARVMFPVLVWMYAYLAKTEQGQMRAEFGDTYDRYASAVPAFIPHRGYGSRSTELPR